MSKNKTNLDFKISVIIPCFKCSDTIDRAIMSVVNQSLSPYEIILIEDYSDDNSRTINKLITLQAKFKGYIKIIKNKKNMGPGFSRNLGWTRSKGNFIGFLDADDTWHLKKLETQCEFLKNNPQIDAVCNFDKYNLNYKNKKINDKKNSGIERVHYNKMLFKNIVSTRSVLIKKSVEDRFNSTFWYSEDYWLWLNLLHKGKKIIKLPFYLSGYYKKPSSNKGLSSHLLNFFISEFMVLKSQPSNSLQKIIIKYLALAFCVIKFLKRCFFYILTLFKIGK
jgi:glycosyltransferase involved in cell wall biosynthesis